MQITQRSLLETTQSGSVRTKGAGGQGGMGEGTAYLPTLLQL